MAVPPRQYNLKIELQGFRTAIREKIDLAVDLRTRLDVPMELGQMSETIEVTGIRVGHEHDPTRAWARR